MPRVMVIGPVCLSLLLVGCGAPVAPEDPDVTYEITSKGAGGIVVRYLKQALPGEKPGAFLGSDGHETTSAPFNAGVHLGDGWKHARIEAKTDPVDTTIALHCVIRHNSTVVTEGDGAGGVTCLVYGDGGSSGAARTP